MRYVGQYVADDGKTFASRDEVLKYEAQQGLKTVAERIIANPESFLSDPSAVEDLVEKLRPFGLQRRGKNKGAPRLGAQKGNSKGEATTVNRRGSRNAEATAS